MTMTLHTQAAARVSPGLPLASKPSSSSTSSPLQSCSGRPKRRRKSGAVTRRLKRDRDSALTQVATWVDAQKSQMNTELPAVSWDFPKEDPGAWLTSMSSTQQRLARNQLSRIQDKMSATISGQMGGHWSRHERRLGNLEKDYPKAPQVQTVQHGYRFQMTHLPTQNYLPKTRFPPETTKVRSLLWQSWERDGIITAVTEDRYQSFQRGERTLLYQFFFVVTKNNKTGYFDVTVSNVEGKWRGCLNSKWLNTHLLRDAYKADSQQYIEAVIKQNGWCVATDVSRAFNTIDLSDGPLGVEPKPLTTSRGLCCFTVPDDPVFTKKYPRGAQMAVVFFGGSPHPLV